jgi:hypothetical protein
MNIDAREIVSTIRELNQFAHDYESESQTVAKLFRHASWMIRELSGQLVETEHLTLQLIDRLNEMKEWTQ